MSKEYAELPMRAGAKVCFDLAKRIFDLVVGSLLLAAFAPLLFLVAILIRRDSSGPALFRQIRIGRNNRPFFIYKFRTMYLDADQQGPQITAGDDPRVTPLGRSLRNCKIDELPQLLNVVRGEMSLVGPRPQVPRFVNAFSPEYRPIVLAVRPGITGPTQLTYRNEEVLLEGQQDREQYYIDKLLPNKCRMDVEYVLNRSVTYDVRVLCETTRIVVRGIYLRVRRRKSVPALHVEPLD